MAIDPTRLRPFLGELDVARTHAQSVRSAIDSLEAPGADPESLLYAAQMDAGFVSAALRDAARQSAPREAATGAHELSRRSGEQLDTLLGELGDVIRAAGGRTDAATVGEQADQVRRATDRLLRWDLDDLAHSATQPDEGAALLGTVDDLGRWTSFDERATRAIADARSVVRADTDDLARQLHELDEASMQARHQGDDLLAQLDGEIELDEGIRAIDDITIAGKADALLAKAPTLDARAASAMESIPVEAHVDGVVPKLAEQRGGSAVAGSEELLDAVPDDGDRVVTMVIGRGHKQGADMPLLASGRTLRFPTRDAAMDALRQDPHSAWIVQPERAGGWRAIEVNAPSNETAAAQLDAVRTRSLDVLALRGEAAAVRGYVVRGHEVPLRRDAPTVPTADELIPKLRGRVSDVYPGHMTGFPDVDDPLVALDVRGAFVRGNAVADLTVAPWHGGELVEGTRDAALDRLRAMLRRDYAPEAAAVVQLDTGRYAVVAATGRSGRQLKRAIDEGATPRMLDPRVEAFGARAKRDVALFDTASGTRI